MLKKKALKRKIVNVILFIIFCVGSWIGLDTDTLLFHKIMEIILFACVLYQGAAVSFLHDLINKQNEILTHLSASTVIATIEKGRKTPCETEHKIWEFF